MGAELSVPQAGSQAQSHEHQRQESQQESEKYTPVLENQGTSNDKPKVIFERYIEPQGTKIEVQPADVIESADVIKKKENKKTRAQ
jgi:hypothetical protein